MATRKRLGEILIEAGVIDEHQLLSALGHQKQWGVKLGQALVDLKIATELQIVDALSKKLGYESVRLDRVEASPVIDTALKLVPRDLARAQNVLPLASDSSSMTLAMSDPTNIAIVDEIAFRSGKRVRVVLAGDREIARNVRKLYFPEEMLKPVEVDLSGAHPIETTSDWFTSMSGEVSATFKNLENAIEIEDEPEVAAAEATPGTNGPSIGSAPEKPQAGVVAPGTRAEGAEARPAAAAPRVEAPAAADARARPTTVPPASTALLTDVVDRMLRGERAPGGLEPGRLVAAAVRVLLRKGAFSEAELLAELMRK